MDQAPINDLLSVGYYVIILNSLQGKRDYTQDQLTQVQQYIFENSVPPVSTQIPTGTLEEKQLNNTLETQVRNNELEKFRQVRKTLKDELTVLNSNIQETMDLMRQSKVRDLEQALSECKETEECEYFKRQLDELIATITREREERAKQDRVELDSRAYAYKVSKKGKTKRTKK